MRMAPLLLMLACSSTPKLTPDTTAPPTSGVTWTDVAPTLASACTRCHSDQGTASFQPFTHYADTAPYAPLMAEKASRRAMPPFGPQLSDWCPTDFHWASDVRLTDGEVALLQAWSDDGAAEGRGATEPLNVPTDVPVFTGTNMTLTAAEWTTNPNIADQTICFILDPGLTEAGWLEGVNLVPGNLTVVHHAGVRMDYTGEAEALANDEGWYDCTGGSGVAMEYLGTYAPGSGPSEVPEGAATLIFPNTKLVLSVHYHSIPNNPVVDQTSLQLRWAEAPPERLALLMHWPNPPTLPLSAILQPGEDDPDGEPKLLIPADVAHHTETLAVQGPGTPDERYEIYQISSHMHLVGQSSRIWAEHPDGTIQCLGDLPNWDFNYQQIYRYQSDALPVVPGGSTFWIECVYDNTLGNEPLARSLAERGLTEPIDVSYGSGSFDEMCMFMLGIVKVQDP